MQSITVKKKLFDKPNFFTKKIKLNWYIKDENAIIDFNHF